MNKHTTERMYEITRTHGELVEVVTVVPANKVDKTFSRICNAARKANLNGRISVRNAS